MTFGSLFSGIGGLDLGLERAGLECRWQIEIDDHCRRVLQKHWPGVKRYADIKTVQGKDLEYVDLIAGGFPCQDLSQAGKRAGLEGSRSGLWFEFARLVGEIRPRYVLAENVPGLLTLPGAMGTVCGELARLGYVGLNRCLRASDFGASHLRKRVFIVAYAVDGGLQERRPAVARPVRHARDEDQRPAAAQPGDDVAAAGIAGGRRFDVGEIDASQGRGAKFRDGGQELADGDEGRRSLDGVSGKAQGWESCGEYRRSSGTLADSEPARFDGGERTGIQRVRSPLSAARSEHGDGDVADADGGQRQQPGRPQPDAGLLSGSDGRSGPLDDADLDGEERPGRAELLADAGREDLEDAEYPGPSCAGAAPGSGAAPALSLRSGDDVGDSRGSQRWAHDERRGRAGEGNDREGQAPGGSGQPDQGMGYAEDERSQGQWTRRQQESDAYGGAALPLRPGTELPAFAPGPGDPRWPLLLQLRPDLAPALEHSQRRPQPTPVKSGTERGTRTREDSGRGRDDIPSSPELADPLRRHDRGERAGHPDQRRDGPEGQAGEPACGEGDAGPGTEAAEPEICRVADGPADRLDRTELDRAMRDRTKRLSRLGNAVVPQCAEWIGRRLLDWEASR